MFISAKAIVVKHQFDLGKHVFIQYFVLLLNNEDDKKPCELYLRKYTSIESN